MVLLLLASACAAPRPQTTARPAPTLAAQESPAVSVAPSPEVISTPAPPRRTISVGVLPDQGFAVQFPGTVALFSMEGTVLRWLKGFEVYQPFGFPGRVVLERGRWSYLLRPRAGLLRLLEEGQESEIVRIDQEHVALRPPPGPQEAVGHWRWALSSPDGSTLVAQWSGECEVPTAYFVTPSGFIPVTGDQANPPESFHLGWTSGGRAAVLLPPGACGHGAPKPGVYLFTGPGAGELLVESPGDDVWARMWGAL